MPSWVAEGYRDYDQRLRSVQPIELIEVPLAKRTKNTDIAKAMNTEAEALQKHIRESDKVIVLDVKGKALSTPGLARKLSDWQMNRQDIAIVIGGPDGLAPVFRSKSYEAWSLSALTLPHPIVRIMLIEQLYRGLMINANHPYHRE